LKRDGKLILDESDGYGVEMALQLVTTAGSGEVSIVSMAPNGEMSGMRTALAMGAAKGVLVSDPALAGSDALTTAKVLAAAIQKMGAADLIIAATESSDGYTGTVPEQIAEVLGLPSVTFAKKVEISNGVLPTSCTHQRYCWCCRAALPKLQGHHGREGKTNRNIHRKRPRRFASRLGRRRSENCQRRSSRSTSSR
jgi:electron transfer flavoprotein alpha/beta subunit